MPDPIDQPLPKTTRQKHRLEDHILLETAWEVCNQVGGIYTVIRSKAIEVTKIWEDNYCLIGPYVQKSAEVEFEPAENLNNTFGKVAGLLQKAGIKAHYGTWLVAGKPQVILLDIEEVPEEELENEKYRLWKTHQIESHHGDPLLNQVIAFGYLVRKLIDSLMLAKKSRLPVLLHVHEWLAASTLPEISHEYPEVKTIFTTHATLLGRYISGNDPAFNDKIKTYDWLEEAKKYSIEPQVRIERNAAHHSQIFSTVSVITAIECQYLLDKDPQIILPNGLNIARFAILHEVQNIHQQFKQNIHQFVMGHFFQSYTFDLDNTLYFFTSGRFEFHNKGFNLALDALQRLNVKMQKEQVDKTVIMFLITKKPFYSINPQNLQSRGVMEEVRRTCEEIQQQIGKKLFYQTVSGEMDKFPDINEMVDEYWKLRLRRVLHSWKTNDSPGTSTHQLVDADQDEILHFTRTKGLANKKEDKVKIVYHPDFISPINPLFGIEYGQFVRGCHLGIFPSYYEPWGYTPLECLARGVPAITSDLSGFGDYVLRHFPGHQESGIYVVNRREESYTTAVSQLANFLSSFVSKSRRDRINLRNRSEDAAERFGWESFIQHYRKAYFMAIS